MSNLIDKLQNKIQGNDSSKGNQNLDDQNYGRSGNRAGAGQQQYADDQGIPTDSYGSGQSGQPGMGGQYSNQPNTQSAGQRVAGSRGAGAADANMQQGSRVGGMSGGSGLSASDDAYNTQPSAMGSGRQTRSHGTTGQRGAAAGGAGFTDQQYSQGQGQGQSQFGQQTQGLGKKGLNQGVEQGQKYVERNL